jgi:hypothetical protein
LTTSTTWQRTAQKIKNTTTNTNVDVATTSISNSNNPYYLKQIRDMHDPSLHIKTLEEELLGSIGQALGKQGEKIEICLRNMQKHLQAYQQALQQVIRVDDDDDDNARRHAIVENHNVKEEEEGEEKVAATTLAAARAYNQARQQAIQARWELLVHQQAAGFLVDNHNHVTRLYPIGPALPVVVVVNDDHHHRHHHHQKHENTQERKKDDEKENKTFGD